MGKWSVVKERFLDGYWYVQMNGTTIITCCSEPLATRYALALNIVDAGVDLREAVEKLKLMHTITAQCGTYGVAHTYASWVEDFLRSIANAVEGDKTKEDV